jgi:hypothetical protein
VPDEDGERTGFQGRRYRRGCSASPATATASRTISRSSRPRLEGGSQAAERARARSTSTSTTARRTTASCCSTRSSGASAFSTRSSGPTTTARAPSAAGRPSTTRSSSTSRTRPPTLRLRGGRPRALHGARPRHAGEGAGASCRRTCGGTRSCRPTGARRPATRRRSPRASCGAWSRPPPARATGALTSSPAAARSAPWPPSSGAATC